MNTITHKQFDEFKKRTIPELTALIKAIKKQGIDDEFGHPEDEPGTLPNIPITIATNGDLSDWTYQTGDNSYTGSCYHFPHWSTSAIFRRSNSKVLAEELIEGLADCFEFAD